MAQMLVISITYHIFCYDGKKCFEMYVSTGLLRLLKNYCKVLLCQIWYTCTIAFVIEKKDTERLVTNI